MRNAGRCRVFIGGPVDISLGRPQVAVVAIDVLLSTTTVVTSLAQGRRTVLAGTVDEARRAGRELPNPIRGCEPGAIDTGDFSAFTGPARLTSPMEAGRPLVLIAPTAWISFGRHATYFTCLRNMSATMEALTRREDDVYIIPAGHAGQARCEDDMVAAWSAQKLLDAGFEAGNLRTVREIERWSKAEISTVGLGRGADTLRRLGHQEDLDLVLNQVDDLDVVCCSSGAEVRAVWPTPVLAAAASH